MAEASRLKLQSKFEELLGSRNVYYNPPESVKMVYPAIRYTKKNIDVKRASNVIHSQKDCYEVIVISPRPDDPVIEKIMELPYCSYDRPYKANNLNHDVLTLYY